MDIKLRKILSGALVALCCAAASIVLFPAARAAELPPLEKSVTSFGAAIVGESLYVYGGHYGEAHHYSNTSQSNELLRLNLKKPAGWEAIATGPRLQGLAMVAHDGKLYRVGGFTAHNEEGEEHDLRSTADFARFDPETGKWEDLSPLPAPRSSHDAVVIGDMLYVVGGWALGEGDQQWHDTALVVDLSQPQLQWKELPQPPFKRRALSTGAVEGKLYAIGGMQEEGGPTTRVDMFDPATGKWSEGPSLPGKPMEGFGSSAFEADGKLFVSTIEGNLYRLSADAKTWEADRKLETARFFHRMLPVGEHQLLFVGGANMSIGKFDHLEVIDIE